MARPREFEETVVLDAAMNRFWAQGYELTSVRDLAASMALPVPASTMRSGTSARCTAGRWATMSSEACGTG